MSWTRTDYFTYFTDGNTGTTHRAGDQVWNFRYPGDRRDYSIWVSGTNPQNGNHNAFAKKHLLTVKGGKSGDLEEKLADIHSNRRLEDIDGYNAKRAKQHSRMSLAGQAQYPTMALGGQAMNTYALGDTTSTLSVVVCDLIPPDKLRYAFAKALSAANLQAGQATQHIVVRFGDYACVKRHDFMSNETTDGNTITVTAYCTAINAHGVTAHIVHCSG
ncbi:hypothetical protein LPC08_13305 [Roseomonas sp. OT10]|uniref:hypothetical protein n=1 Tax=Roseomonas cutis TaxID=2897332 RepID=UPI001E453337|nr:hypothetical protein [Roseomonas sp. OT10]UFN47005.1 hypothetical protein LPC08_13305 [Roseomonas sp. OT10]